jgi:hypothetical protein
MAELGAGGGYGDTEQSRVELEIADVAVIGSLMELCKDELAEHPEVTKLIVDMLSSISQTLNTPLILERKDYDEQEPDELDAKGLLRVLARKAQREKQMKAIVEPTTGSSSHNTSSALPTRIRFPYSRHSSYNELCLLIKAFKPRDIFPCTVNKRGWTMAHSMSFMFGHLYDSPLLCRHDQYMLSQAPQPPTRKASKRTHSHDPATASTQHPDQVAKDQQPATEKTRAPEPIPNIPSAIDAADQTDQSNKRARVDDDEATGISEVFHSAPEDLDDRRNTPRKQPSASPTVTPRSSTVVFPSGSPSKHKAETIPTTKSNHDPDPPDTREECASSDTCAAPGSEESSQQSLDPALIELALRSEAYQAVIASREGTSWFDMNLISMGHHSDSDREL